MVIGYYNKTIAVSRPVSNYFADPVIGWNRYRGANRVFASICAIADGHPIAILTFWIARIAPDEIKRKALTPLGLLTKILTGN